MKLVVGLGNPGPEYVSTRHNVGFEAIDALAARLGWAGRERFDRLARSSFAGLLIDGMASIGSGGSSEKLLLLKPTTYMNLSGRSVREAVDFYKLPLEDVLVIVDEMALPVGRIRLRGEGSDGGHNGLKSVQQMLGTPRYARIRIGVGQPPGPIAGRDWVLGTFRAEERAPLAASIDKAAACALAWAESGLVKAMNVFNVGDSARPDQGAPQQENHVKANRTV
jgi:PTH1 family peptidyl-tRNA hydrolase